MATITPATGIPAYDNPNPMMPFKGFSPYVSPGLPTIPTRGTGIPAYDNPQMIDNYLENVFRERAESESRMPPPDMSQTYLPNVLPPGRYELLRLSRNAMGGTFADQLLGRGVPFTPNLFNSFMGSAPGNAINANIPGGFRPELGLQTTQVPYNTYSNDIGMPAFGGGGSFRPEPGLQSSATPPTPGGSTEGVISQLPALRADSSGESRIDPSLRPYLELGLRRGEQLFFGEQQPSLYPGQMYVSPTQQTLDALAAQERMARSGSPALEAAQESYGQALG
jgi:hypothetical protein